MELEIRRNIFHMIVGIVFVILIYFDIINSSILFVFLILALILSFLSLYVKIPILYWFLKKFDRPDDLQRFPGKGSIMFILGVLIAFYFFPKDIALAGIMILTFGDSINTIVGLRGRIKNPFNKKRFIEGFIAGFAFAFVGALFFVSFVEALIASFIAMVFEGFDIKLKLNDNVTIPLVSCLSIYLLRFLLLTIT